MKTLKKIVLNLIFKYFGLKFTAVILAVLTWFAIQELTSHLETLNVIPLHIQHTSDVRVEGIAPETFEIIFRGTKRDVLALRRDSVRLELNIKGLPFQPKQTLNLEAKHVIYPGTSRVLAIHPGKVTIQLARQKKSTKQNHE